MDALLNAENLTRRFPGKRGVEDISLTLQPGDIVGLAGLNGAGKSTTLGMLAGTLRPSGGRVLVQGRDLRRDTAARALIGFAPDQPPLYPELTVREYLEYVAALHGLVGTTAREAVDRASSDCQLEDVPRRLIRTLSRGYRQRVGIAQALLPRPPVLLLDEPSEGLDPQQTARLRRLIADHANQGAVLLSTHQLAIIAGLCTRLLVLDAGRVVQESEITGQSEEALHRLFAGATGMEAS